MTTMRRILLDVDGVVADLVGALCTELAGVGHQRTPADFDRYEFKNVLPACEAHTVRSAMARQGFCASMPWYPGARTFVECLQEFADVVAVTKPYPKGPTWAYERAQWLHPVITRVIQTDVKECVAGDVLVEDYEANIATWLEANPYGRAVLIDRPWNRHVSRDFHPRMRRAHSFGQAVYLATSVLGVW